MLTARHRTRCVRRSLSEPDCRVQCGDLGGTEFSSAAQGQLSQPHGTQLDPDQALDWMPNGPQQSAHDVLAAFVQDDLDHDPVAAAPGDPEAISTRLAVVELDTGAQPAAHVGPDRPPNL